MEFNIFAISNLFLLVTKMKKEIKNILELISLLEKLNIVPWNVAIFIFICMEAICIRCAHVEWIYFYHHQYTTVSLFIQPILINIYCMYKVLFWEL